MEDTRHETSKWHAGIKAKCPLFDGWASPTDVREGVALYGQGWCPGKHAMQSEPDVVVIWATPLTSDQLRAHCERKGIDHTKLQRADRIAVGEGSNYYLAISNNLKGRELWVIRISEDTVWHYHRKEDQ